jgi:tetratricopeptide (TPR) repeat protein
MMRQYTESLPCCQTALAMYERLRDERGMAAAWHHLAFIYEAQGDLDQAVKIMEKVVTIDVKYGLPKLNENRQHLEQWKKRVQETGA